MTFRVGMKITPKTPTPWGSEGDGQSYPAYGVVYTVRATEILRGEQYVWLVEIVNAARCYVDSIGEQSFASEDFRPAVSPKQEVSFTTGADPDSEIHDNRRRVPVREKAWGASA